MIAENTIKNIRELNIEDVVSKYVKITHHKACCPFHNESTPSFGFHKKSNRYKCFGCGESGDGIAFVMKHDRLTFSEALESLAKQHNITIEYENTLESPEERKHKLSKLDTAKQILNFAHAYYQKQLQENDSMKAYLLERGYDDDKILEWQLGFAPNDFKNITPTIVNNGWYDVAIEIGLIKTKNSTNYDTYRNRITIPIFDKNGQIIGFGGRYVGDDKTQSKYFNPNENFLYSKSTVLFGLDRSNKAIQENDMAIMQEGYFDVMSSMNAGLDNVVAPCGTACDEKQLKLLMRYTKNLTIMYDGDKAGLKATEKLIVQAIELGMNVFVVPLQGSDPDDYARNYNPKN